MAQMSVLIAFFDNQTLFTLNCSSHWLHAGLAKCIDIDTFLSALRQCGGANLSPAISACRILPPCLGRQTLVSGNGKFGPPPVLRRSRLSSQRFSGEVEGFSRAQFLLMVMVFIWF